MIGKTNVKVKPNKKINYVEYIESTGTQYIDTGYNASSSTNIVLDYEFLTGESGRYIPFMGHRFTIRQKMFGIWVNQADYKIAINFGTVDTGGIENTNASGRHVYSNIGNKFYIDGELIQEISTSEFSCDGSLSIFALKTATSTYETRNSQGRLYSMKIYDNDALVRDFKPCKDGAGVYCLYDEVEKRYYYNQGTGSFMGRAKV